MPITPGQENPQIPSMVSEIFQPDQLIAGRFPIVSAQGATLTGGAALPRGSVLGVVTQPTLTATATYAPIGTDTGNGTIGTITVGAAAALGVYDVTFLTATAYEVTNPSGQEIGHGTTGVAFNAGGLGFTITAGGTAFVAGDSFAITTTVATAATGFYKLAVSTATDGSAVPVAILADYTDASAGNILGAAIYLAGEFNINALNFGAGVTAASAAASLRANDIFLRTPVVGGAVASNN